MEKLGFGQRLRHAWDVFKVKDTPVISTDSRYIYTSSSGINNIISRRTVTNSKTIIGAIYDRIARDVMAVDIIHARLDTNKQYVDTLETRLNNCLTLEANLDQTSQYFLQDILLSLFDEGVVAVVPTVTTENILKENSWDIKEMRVGKIVGWHPEHVDIDLYNYKLGQTQVITLPKKVVAIIVNPLYSVMNDRNSALQRLLRKLALLDAIDEQSGSGKLDIIIQLPYTVNSERRKEVAKSRAAELDSQMANSKYGVAYTDGTEKITQLNRPAENNIMKQVEYLTEMVYSQLGVPKAVFDGTADEKMLTQYYTTTIEPILKAITLEFSRKFLTKTARTQGQSIIWIRDPFKNTPAVELSNMIQVTIASQVLTPNEWRGKLGMMPSDNPMSDALINPNINPNMQGPEMAGYEDPQYYDESQDYMTQEESQ